MSLRQRRQRGVRAGAVAAVVATALGAAGCGQENVYHEPPPPEVVVVRPVRRAVTRYLEYTGTAQASERVDLRARVKGFLKERKFRDGDDVKAGQLLFVIDEESFRVRLDQAKAKLEEAEAALRKSENSKAREIARAQVDLSVSQLALAVVEEDRSRKLLSRNAGSREDLDRAEASRKRAEAQVEADRATLEQAETDFDINILAARSALAAARSDVRNAEIDLGYCRVAAPIDGRINAREIDVGNYVGEGQSVVLATIVRMDPIYAYVTPGEGDLLRIQSMVGRDYRDAKIPMEMKLGEERAYPYEGRVDYIDPSVDTGTGTVRVRGVFANPGATITPGLFVHVRMPFEKRQDALLVPDRALGADQAGPFLLVVGEGDKVERRAVEPGTVEAGLREVTGAIGADDRVVVDGLLRARPGLQVAPRVENRDPAAAPALSLAEDD
jgi:RND family efflux transporter MFP subunit